MFIFFFSSRRRHTRLTCDWSSDVCSSDLGDIKARSLDVVSQQNARGAFTFTGGSTGSDFGDFLLGLPHASAIAFGNADKNLRATMADAYVTDDWRISPSFTANVGVRW